MEGDHILRSRESIHNAFVLFVNKTQRTIDIYWVDYEGKYVSYMTLDPGGRTIVNTFSTHPWIFRDKYTGERMQVENNDVFWPKPFFINGLEQQLLLPRRHNGSMIRLGTPALQRKQIDIHFPMRTLRENALWNMIKYIKRIEDIDQLRIPKILNSELRSIFKEYDKHRRRNVTR